MPEEETKETAEEKAIAVAAKTVVGCFGKILVPRGSGSFVRKFMVWELSSIIIDKTF